jgi:Fe-S-cluster containining protein
MANDVFYQSGLRFECTRCSSCCRHTPGYVFLSSADLDVLSLALGMNRQDVLRTYCRQVPLGLARRISLKEKANFDCILWENGGCSVYQSRPLQCRSFPFWSGCVSSLEEWEHHGRQCPGIGRGALHTRQEIDRWLEQRHIEGFLEA